MNIEKELLQRYVEGNVSAEEIQTVVDWLDEDKENVREFMALHKLYDISVLNKSGYAKSTQQAKKLFSYRKVAYELLKVAAILLLFWVGSSLFNRPSKEANIAVFQTLYVPAGQRAELTLADSTKVWLNAGSRLTYPTNFEKGTRSIELDGEAYFAVAHNEKQPFVVKTEKMNIEVLGTEFNVIAYSGSLLPEVSLLKGSVELSCSDIAGSYRMKPRETVRLVTGKLVVSKIDDYDQFRWKEGLICFNNETVKTIMDKLQLYYDIRIDIQNIALLNNYYSGKFRTKDGVEQVLKVLQIEHKFSYTKNNELNLITIE